MPDDSEIPERLAAARFVSLFHCLTFELPNRFSSLVLAWPSDILKSGDWSFGSNWKFLVENTVNCQQRPANLGQNSAILHWRFSKQSFGKQRFIFEDLVFVKNKKPGPWSLSLPFKLDITALFKSEFQSQDFDCFLQCVFYFPMLHWIQNLLIQNILKHFS